MSQGDPKSVTGDPKSVTGDPKSVTWGPKKCNIYIVEREPKKCHLGTQKVYQGIQKVSHQINYENPKMSQWTLKMPNTDSNNSIGTLKNQKY